MLKRNKFIFSLLGILFSSNSYAGDYLTSKEIKELVSGNSITGIWRGKEFRQNVHPDGMVTVNIKTMKQFNIPWIVNDKNEYCENWGEWGWGCYKFKKISNNKYLSIRTDTKHEEKSTWTTHPGYIDINF